MRAKHGMRVLLLQMKGMGRPGNCTGGGSTDQDAEGTREGSGGECSTSYHHTQDISQADFRAVGTDFQASTLYATCVQQQQSRAGRTSCKHTSCYLGSQNLINQITKAQQHKIKLLPPQKLH